MKPRDSQAKSPQAKLFQARLDQQLDPKHPLFRLAQQIDWSYLKRMQTTLSQLKGSLGAVHSMQADEVRLLKAYLKSRDDE